SVPAACCWCPSSARTPHGAEARRLGPLVGRFGREAERREPEQEKDGIYVVVVLTPEAGWQKLGTLTPVATGAAVGE
ncbi:MAG: hypothetical protein ACJ79S_12425, partial [Gemmatimonadaceae bacterium]